MSMRVPWLAILCLGLTKGGDLEPGLDAIRKALTEEDEIHRAAALLGATGKEYEATKNHIADRIQCKVCWRAAKLLTNHTNATRSVRPLMSVELLSEMHQMCKDEELIGLMQREGYEVRNNSLVLVKNDVDKTIDKNHLMVQSWALSRACLRIFNEKFEFPALGDWLVEEYEDHRKRNLKLKAAKVFAKLCKKNEDVQPVDVCVAGPGEQRGPIPPPYNITDDDTSSIFKALDIKDRVARTAALFNTSNKEINALKTSVAKKVSCPLCLKLAATLAGMTTDPDENLFIQTELIAAQNHLCSGSIQDSSDRKGWLGQLQRAGWEVRGSTLIQVSRENRTTNSHNLAMQSWILRSACDTIITAGFDTVKMADWLVDEFNKEKKLELVKVYKRLCLKESEACKEKQLPKEHWARASAEFASLVKNPLKKNRLEL